MTNVSEMVWRDANYDSRNRSTPTGPTSNMPIKFYGDCVRSSNSIGAIGIIGKSGNYTMQAQRSAEKIADAGSEGLSVDSVMLFDIQTLQAAGVPVRQEGFRFYLDERPNPTAWLRPVAGGAA